MKTRYTSLRPLFAGLSVLALAATSASAATLLSIDFGSGAVETGFTGQSASGAVYAITPTTSITVAFSGQQGTFDRGAIAGSNQALYRDFIFDNGSDPVNPDITISLTGNAIAANTQYTLTFYSYDSGDTSKQTTFSGFNGTTGTSLVAPRSGISGQPDSINEYAVTGTFTSSATGTLTFALDGPRTVVNGFKLESIPEPSIALLGGLGLICLLRRRR